MVFSAVGLAQNLSAILALATVGIQKGHMRLHARNIAISAGALGNQVDTVADKMIREGKISTSRAKEIILSIIDQS
jgi:hydroxymethylglutaryl-CoA reductase